MKIFTNFRFYRVAGIAQTVLLFLDYLKASASKLQVVGVDIPRRGDKRGERRFGRNKIFSLLSPRVSYQGLEEVMRRAKTVDQIQAAYEPVIQSYRAALEETKPDVVLVNGTYTLPWCLFLAAQQFSLPIVLHYHGVFSKETAHWRKGRRALAREMEKMFASRIAHYIFPSRLAKETVEREVFAQAAKNFSVIPNPVRPSFFNAPASPKANNIGAVMRWTASKNYRFLEKLARYNRERGREFRFNVVTDLRRSDRRRKRMRSLIRFKNTMEQKALARFYGRMRVVLCPSLFETYGNVASEALACGTPALVSPNMGVAETFRELGLERWIIDFASPAKVMEKIKEAANEAVSDEARQKLKEIRSPEAIYPQIISILRSVSEGK